MATETLPPPAADPERDRLADAIRAMIAAGVGGDPSPFDSLALQLFAWQFAHNVPYRQFCTAKGVTPDTVQSWRNIPAFPTDAFKTDIVTSFSFEQAVMAQLTSGTTANRRGQIFRDALGLELVLSANRTMTAAYLFPDFGKGQRCRILILAPSPEMAPSMGMAIGMEETRKHFGTPDSRFLLEWHGLDIKGLVDAVMAAERSGVPLAMIGSTSAFVFFLKSCKEKGWRFRLPAGSRLADGGGYRGRFGELTQQDFFGLAEEVLGIPETHCVNVLGMAESATNYFDATLRAAVRGEVPRRRRLPPPWARVEAVSPTDLTPLPPGEVGLLRHYDLVNLPTVIAVQTDNLGVTDADGGFQILGRAKLVDGKVAPLPSERVVGPMGDKRIFRFLESYVNFSIRFKMGLLGRKAVAARPLVPPSCPCDQFTEDLVAQADPESAPDPGAAGGGGPAAAPAKRSPR